MNYKIKIFFIFFKKYFPSKQMMPAKMMMTLHYFGVRKINSTQTNMLKAETDSMHRNRFKQKELLTVN